MEDILGLIIFILIIAFRTISDRKQGMTRGKKGKPTPPPRAKTKPQVQAEPAGPRKKRPAETQSVPPYPGEFQPVRKAAAVTPTPLMPPLEEGESDYERIAGREEIPPTGLLGGAGLQPATAVEGQVGSGLSYEELRRAVLWSEILGKPRSRRSIR